MEMQYFKDYSPALGREMECKVYGHAGRPILYIPCQDGRFFDFEDFHMADTLAPWIDSGKVMVLSIDTLDQETWSDPNGNPYWRIRRYEQWLRYIVDEAVPKLQQIARERNGWDGNPGVIAFGCSLGATHAVNLYLRRPDVFCGCLALSGIYTSCSATRKRSSAAARAPGSSRTPPGISSAFLRPSTSPSGWICGARMSSMTGIGGTSRRRIICRMCWESNSSSRLWRQPPQGGGLIGSLSEGAGTA